MRTHAARPSAPTPPRFFFASGPFARVPRPAIPDSAALALAAVLAAAVLSGCQPAGSQPRGGMPPPEVSVITIAPQTLPQSFEYTGQTAGSREVEVRARVTGILQKRGYAEGGRVAQGQSLYTIDPAPFDVALAGAEAGAAGADAAVVSAEARLAQARRNGARLKPLFEARAASQKDFDDAVSSEQIADADLKAARARAGEARAKVNEARLNLKYTRVDSPVSGIIGRSQRPEGTLVSGPDVLLATVSQTDPVYVYFGVSDNEHLRLQRDVAEKRLVLPKDGRFDVAVTLADGSTYARTGRLSFSDVRLSGVTGTAESRAELPNPNGVLRPGQFVRVTLRGAMRPGAITVPQRAVLDGPRGKFVYLVNAESRVEPRPVEVGEWAGGAWIVNSGLREGDRVVIDGLMKIGPGAPVRVAAPGADKGAAPGGAAGALPVDAGKAPEPDAAGAAAKSAEKAADKKGG